MASAVVPSRRTSASRVTLLLQGIRHLTAMAPRASRSSVAGSHDMAVGPGTDVAARIHGLMAHRADRSARLHQRLDARDEGGGLFAREGHAGHRRLVLRLLLLELARLDEHAVAVPVVAGAER